MATEIIRAFTIMTPVLRDHDGDVSHVLALRNHLRSLPADQRSPLAQVPGTHMARLVVMDDVPYPGAPSDEDHLGSAYLLFVADVDGELDPYLASLARGARPFVEAVWSHCVAYPGVGHVPSFVRYMKRCALATALFFADVKDASVPQRRRALWAQAELAAFIARNQGRSPCELQREFRDFVGGALSPPQSRADLRDAELPASATRRSATSVP